MALRTTIGILVLLVLFTTKSPCQGKPENVPQIPNRCLPVLKNPVVRGELPPKMNFKSYTVVSPRISYTVTEAGGTENVQLVKSSGYPAVDAWAVSRNKRMRF